MRVYSHASAKSRANMLTMTNANTLMFRYNVYYVQREKHR